MFKNFSKYQSNFDLPNLIEIQLNSYKWFLKQGLKELFEEVSPIKDWAGKDLELYFLDYYFDEPKYTENEAKIQNSSYEASMRCKLKLVNKKTGQNREQEIYLGDFPLMTNRGTFIVNGVERVVVSQLIRSAGVFLTLSYSYGGQKFFGAKIIPNRGAWLEFETDRDGVISVKIDRKRKVAVTTLLRAFGFSEEKIKKSFQDVDQGQIRFIETTFKKDLAKDQSEAFIEIYRRLRPGDLAAVDNAKQLIEAMFFNFERYDLGKVGRWKLNQRLSLNVPNAKEFRIFQPDDLVYLLKEIIRLNNDPEAQPDDIDHLGNRRIRAVGELLQNKLRIGIVRMARIIRDRMTTLDLEALYPAQLINARPFIAVVKEFFTNSQLSQFMDQVNPLSELEHKRRISTMGPGGLTRERAGFEVRDVHSTYYGRICPIQTPEGPNIGLVGHLSCFARLNDYGFIETPYRKVNKGQVSDQIEFLDAFKEQRVNIAHAGVELDKLNNFIEPTVEARVKGQPSITKKEKIDYMDISPQQSISVATSLIPFLEHNDANRALMGSNMQRQAVSCIKPEAPLVGTGIEKKAAMDSGQLVLAEEDGVVVEIDSGHIKIADKSTTFLAFFMRSLDIPYSAAYSRIEGKKAPLWRSSCILKIFNTS